MKNKSASNVPISDLLASIDTGFVTVNIQDVIDEAAANPLSLFTEEELVAELLRRTSLGKELE